MAKSALSRPSVQESVGRSAADLSAPRNFHQSAGMLIPVFSRAFIAGTDGYIDRSSFTRTKNPLFPAFQQVTQCVDVFQVPIRYLFTPWNDWKLNINDINSSNFFGGDAEIVPTLMASVPRLDFGSSFYQRVFEVGQVKTSQSFSASLAYVNDFNRLCDALDYGQDTIFGNAACQMSLFMLAAYQKIYYDFYRNTSYERNNPYAYNLDWLWNVNNGLLATDSTPEASQAWYALEGLTQLRYANYRNDYFHNIYPSLNTVVSLPTGVEWQVPDSVVGLVQSLGSYVIAPNNSPRAVPSGQVITGMSYGSNPSSNQSSLLGPNVQQIRAAFALDKLMRASAYTPKHVKDQFKARFDVDVPESVGMESFRIGSWQNDITFGEVTSTADTSNGSSGQSLGAVGGKGVGSARDGKIHFHCKEDSIVMAIQYFVPLAIYDSKSLGDWNTKLVREDFFQPEFQNLGLRPMYRKSLRYDRYDVAKNNYIIGYTVPNQYYKVPVAKNYGIFNKNYSYLDGLDGSPVVMDASTPLSAFTTHIEGMTFNSSNGVDYRYFKVSPHDLDSLFQQAYVDGQYDTDQFYGQVRFGVQVTHNMTVHGMPSI